MRVLTVGNRYPADGGGGYEAVWRALVAHLRGTGDLVEVLTSDERGPALPGVHRELPWYWSRDDWRGLRRRAAVRLQRDALTIFAGHMERLRPDVVVWVSMGGLPLALVSASGTREVALVHDGWPIYGAEVDPCVTRDGWSPGGVATWSFNSSFARDRCAGALGDPAPERMRVDHPGVDPVRFAPAAAPPWAGRLAVVGRVEPRKGVADAVHALAYDDSWSLTITGPAERDYDTEIEALAHDLEVRERVRLTGPAPDVRAAYAGADVVLFPPVWEEPFGLVPLEAMSVGRTVVASGTGGSAEYLRHEMNCLLVPPGDPTALAAAVARLAGDPALRAQLVAGGHRTAAMFTEQRWCEAVAGMLRQAHGPDAQILP